MQSISIKLLILSLILSVIHHIDHIIRVDHSGWPFLPRISPFTYSLLAYPVFLSIFMARSRSVYRFIATGVLFLFSTAAHLFLEPLSDKFHTWTYGSNLPGHTGEQNLLGLQSKYLGIASIAIAVLLSLSLLATLIYFIKDWSARVNKH